MEDHFAFLLPIIMLTFGCAFLVVWRAGGRPAGEWGIAYLLNALAFAVPVLLARLPDDAQGIVADGLFAVAFGVYGRALLVRFGGPRLTPALVGLVALTIGASAYTVLVLDSLRAELVASDVGCALPVILALVMVRGRARHPVDRAILAISALVVLDNLVRTSTVLVTTSSDDLAAFMSSQYTFLMQATASVLGLVFGLTALAAVTLDVVEGYRDQAMRDALTGLLNRRGFDHAVRMGAPGRARPASVVTCDIDHFKRVNDRFGHAVGDRVIAGFAGVITASLPAGAAAARFGGEEFVVYLPRHDAAEAGRFADAVRLALAAHDWSGAGVDRRLTASFGVSAVQDAESSVHDALVRADRGLYDAKAAGRDRIMTRLAAAVS